MALEPGEPDPANALEVTQAQTTTQTVPGGGAIDLLSGGLSIGVVLDSAKVSALLGYDIAARYSSKDQWQVHANPPSLGEPGACCTLADECEYGGEATCRYGWRWHGQWMGEGTTCEPDTCEFPRHPRPDFDPWWERYFATWSPDDMRDNTRFDDGICAGTPDGLPDHGWSTELGWGWRFSLGRVAQLGGRHVVLPDGSVHKLYRLGDNEVPPGDGGSKQLVTRDGSRLRATWFRNVDAVYGEDDRYRNRVYKVYAPNGVIYEYGHYVLAPGDCGDEDNKVDDYQRNGWYLTSMSDPFGNRVDVEYHDGPYTGHIIRRIVDTHGRQIVTTLTTSADPVVANRIETITWLAEDGEATTTFEYHPTAVAVTLPPGGFQHSCDPPDENQTGRQVRVALLRSIHLPEGVTHSFEYNAQGEVSAHVLPTGGRAEYDFATYTWHDQRSPRFSDQCGPRIGFDHQGGRIPMDGQATAVLQGRGVVAHRLVASPGEVAEWRYYRDQVWDDDCVAEFFPRNEFHVNVKDPEDMWRTLTFLEDAIDPEAACTTVTLPVAPFLHHAYVWEQPLALGPGAEPWPGIDCGAKPPGDAALHFENKWEIDGWKMDSTHRMELVGQSARVYWTKTTFDDGTWQTVDRCGWDGFGHFEQEVVRASPTLSTPERTTFQRHAPLVCQWILDQPILEQVAEGGLASTIERRFTADGQVAREIRRADPDPFSAPTCDNASEPLLKTERIGRDVEEALEEHVNNRVDETSFVGPWRFESTRWCDGRYIGMHVQDLPRLGMPDGDPAAPSTCNPDPQFRPPTTPIDRRPGSSDVQSDYTYYGSRLQADNADDHGHAAWGQLRSTVLTGGDSSASFEKLYEWACGTAETERWADFAWYVMDNDVQCDGAVPNANNSGLILAKRDSAGFATTFRHDDLDRVVEIAPEATNPAPALGTDLEAPTTITYSPDLRKKSTVQHRAGADDLDSVETYETFDALGRPILTQVRLPSHYLYRTQATKYDLLGRMAWRSNLFASLVLHVFTPGSHGTTYSYRLTPGGSPEPLGRLVSETFADGRTMAFAYVGRRISTTVSGINDYGGWPPSSATTTRWYDAFGRLRLVDLPSDPSFPAADATQEYDRNDKLTRVTQAHGAEQQVRTWRYDALGRLLESSHPESGTTAEMTYDAAGNLLTFLDAEGRVHLREYDQASRLTANGELLGAGFRSSEVFEYDDPASGFSAGKITASETRVPASQTMESRRELIYGGLSGRLSAIRYEDAASPRDRSAEIGYENLGNVEIAQYPHPAGQTPFVVRWTYRHGRQYSVSTDEKNVTYVKSATYLPEGVQFLVLGNGVIQQDQYDERDRFSRILTGYTGEVFDSGEFSYDGAGNLANLGPTARRGSNHFVYDVNMRLTGAALSGVGAYYSLYDAFGNMTTQSLVGLGTCPSHELNLFSSREYRMGMDNIPGTSVTNRISVLGVDPSCHAGSTIQYSNVGEVLRDETAKYTYDVLGRMRSRTALASGAESYFTYDGKGWRTVVKNDPGEVKQYLRGPAGETWLEATATGAGDVAYIYFNGAVAATRTWSLGGNFVDRWHHLDHLGSTRAITLESGAVEARYDFGPFGIEMPGSDPTQPRIFAGHLREGDDSYDYMLGRYFSGRHSRFLSVDSEGRSAKAAHPQSWNRYSYCLNNPMISTDPDGLASYLVVYGNGYLSPAQAGLRGDQGDQFKIAANTIAAKIMASPAFDSTKDAVYVSKAGTSDEFVSLVNTKYPTGPLKKLDVFSHAGQQFDENGKVTSGLLSFGGSEDGEVKWFEPDDVAKVDPNAFEPGAEAMFWGCHAGEDADGSKSISHEFADQAGVETSGYEGGMEFKDEGKGDPPMVPSSPKQKMYTYPAGAGAGCP